MKPNGFVDAAAITSHTSTPRRRHISANSFHEADVHGPERVLECATAEDLLARVRRDHGSDG